MHAGRVILLWEAFLTVALFLVFTSDKASTTNVIGRLAIFMILGTMGRRKAMGGARLFRSEFLILLSIGNRKLEQVNIHREADRLL